MMKISASFPHGMGSHRGKSGQGDSQETSHLAYNIISCLFFKAKGPSIKYVTLFLANFDPFPLSHFVTHPGTPRKYVTHLGPPTIFSRPSTKISYKSPLHK